MTEVDGYTMQTLEITPVQRANVERYNVPQEVKNIAAAVQERLRKYGSLRSCTVRGVNFHGDEVVKYLLFVQFNAGVGHSMPKVPEHNDAALDELVAKLMKQVRDEQWENIEWRLQESGSGVTISPWEGEGDEQHFKAFMPRNVVETVTVSDIDNADTVVITNNILQLAFTIERRRVELLEARLLNIDESIE